MSAAPRRMALPPDEDSVADALFEINALIEPGDASQDVLITGAAWARLLRLASSVPAPRPGLLLADLQEFRGSVARALGASEAASDARLIELIAEHRRTAADRHAEVVELRNASFEPVPPPKKKRERKPRKPPVPAAAEEPVVYVRQLEIGGAP